MGRNYLGELEELVLLAVASLTNEAYAVAVKAELEQRADRVMNISAIHACLYRLEDKGYLQSALGGATKKRGGKSKRLFSVTSAGYQVLKENQEVRQSFWETIPQLSTQR